MRIWQDFPAKLLEMKSGSLLPVHPRPEVQHGLLNILGVTHEEVHVGSGTENIDPCCDSNPFLGPVLGQIFHSGKLKGVHGGVEELTRAG